MSAMNRVEAEEALSLIRQVVNRVHDETVLQNWGTVMVVMGILDLLVFVATDLLARSGVWRWLPYLAIWSVYLALGLAVTLGVRKRRGGTMTYVERHIWGNGLTYYFACFAMVGLDCALLEPDRALALIPAHIAVVGAVSFAFMALIDNRFFLYTAVFFAATVALGLWPAGGFAFLGAVWFLCLVIPGIQYLRERKRLLASDP